MYKLIIIDDHKIFADALTELLNFAGFEILKQYYNSENLFQEEYIYKADILVLDLALPGISGLDLIPEIKKKVSGLKILILSSYASDDILIELYKSGVNGYLPKSSDKQKLIQVINLIYTGETYFADISLEDIMQKNNQIDKINKMLSQREVMIVDLIIKNFSNEEIAKTTYISKNTVKYHKKNIFKKLSVKNSTDLINLIKRNSII